MLNAIPSDSTVIHTITATKPGDHAAAAWAVMRHLGRSGYRASIKNLLEVVQIVSEGIDAIAGLRLLARPGLGVVNFTSDVVDVQQLHLELRKSGWGSTYGQSGGTGRIRLSIHPHRDVTHAREFVEVLATVVEGFRGTKGDGHVT